MDGLKENPAFFGAVDIGGTKISAGITDEEGRLLISERFETGREAEKAVKEISDRLNMMKRSVKTERLFFTGISCAGPVDTEKGTVNNPYTLPGWEEYPIVKKLSELLQTPCKIENDANCALLGEVYLSDLHGKRVFMMSVGTGVGCAFWDGKGFYRTGKKYHPELGHMLIRTDRTPSVSCYCGHYNCVENLLSGTALHKRAGDAGFKDFNDLCTAYYSGFHRQKTAAELFIRDIKAEFFSAFWNYGLTFHPDNIVLSGGMALAYYPLFEDIYKNFREETKDKRDFIPDFTLSRAKEGEDPSLTGAAMLFKAS